MPVGAIIAAISGAASLASGLISNAGQRRAAEQQAYLGSIQQNQGQQMAEDAIKKMKALDITDNQFQISQETRDLADAQQKQFAESQKRIIENQNANVQQAIANYQGDPVRMQSALTRMIPELSAQTGNLDLELAARATDADKSIADLSEKYGQMNVQTAIAQEQYNADLFNQLYGDMRREGSAAAGMGFGAQAEGLISGAGAGARAADTGIATGINTATLLTNMAEAGLFEKEKGGVLKKTTEMKGGGLMDQIMVTGGEFDHDTNKKALIDEETGEKEAELTGDEVVLNPEQTQDTMGAVRQLLQYLESLEQIPPELEDVAQKLSFFKEPQFDVMNGEEDEMIQEEV